MREPPDNTFVSLAHAARVRAEAKQRVEELSASIFHLKREVPPPEDFDERRRELNASLRATENEIAIVEAWIEDHRREGAERMADTKTAAIEANLRQSELAVERDRERTRRHNVEREEKMRLLVGLVRKATPVLARSADPEATHVIDEIRRKAPWLIPEAS